MSTIDVTEKLTRRERDVAALAVEGFKNRDIAEMLRISLKTVKKHKQNIYAKLGVENSVQLLRALKGGVV